MRLSELLLAAIGRVLVDDIRISAILHSHNAPVVGTLIDVDNIQYRVTKLTDVTTDSEREEGLEYLEVYAEKI